MRLFAAIPRQYWFFIFAAAFLNISPYLLQHVSADIWFYMVWLRCFTGQLWQGDIYPRWCLDTNAGLGSPIFLFYFPLPAYLGAFFYPLVKMGLSDYGLFVVLAFVVTLASIITCYYWLADIVTPPKALIAGIFYIFMPYHLEMMFFRGAYSEMCAVAVLPLLFRELRRLVLGKCHIARLALVAAALMLIHVPVTADVLFLSTVYMLAMTRSIPVWRRWVAAMAWAVAMAAFYLIPGAYYSQFRADNEVASGLFGWPNHFVTLALFRMRGMERPLIAAFASILVWGILAALWLIRRHRIPDAFTRRESMAMVIMAALAVALLFPFSAPLYALAGGFSKIFFPWRMQVLVMLASTYLFAVWMQWLMPASRLKTWKSDMAVAFVGLWLASNALVATFTKEGDALNAQISQSKIVFASEYRNRWTDPPHWEYDYLLARARQDIPKAQVIGGEGRVQVSQWNWRAFVIETESKKPLTLRLNHSYFPVWRATLDDAPLAIRPEGGTGQMLLDIPAGHHTARLSWDVANGLPLLGVTRWLSLIAFILVILNAVKDLSCCNRILRLRSG